MQGCAKPFFKKLRVLDNKEHFVSLKHFAVEVVASFANWILRKHDDKILAARIPFHKEGDALKVDSAPTHWKPRFNTALANPSNPALKIDYNSRTNRQKGK